MFGLGYTANGIGGIFSAHHISQDYLNILFEACTGTSLLRNGTCATKVPLMALFSSIIGGTLGLKDVFVFSKRYFADLLQH